jgi:hypothetical protein
MIDRKANHRLMILHWATIIALWAQLIVWWVSDHPIDRIMAGVAVGACLTALVARWCAGKEPIS